MRKFVTSHFLLLLPGLFLLGGCQTIGPKGIETGRQSYNEAIQRTNDEQLLLNLVRLHYRDNPLFLEIGSVSSQMRLETGADIGANFTYPGRALDSYGAGARIGVSDAPTISYGPLQGEEFTEQLLRPISVTSLLLLYHSGWSVERIMRMTVQRMNGERNAFNSSGPTPAYPPRFENFVEATRILRDLQISDGIDMGYETADDRRVPKLFVMPSVKETESWQRFAHLLRLDPNHPSYTIRGGTALGEWASDQIVLNTRSLLGVLYFLSQSVEVPEAHRKAGLVTITRHPDGREFDWDPVLEDLMRIKSARRPPADAAVAVQYRGYWFYVSDTDLAAKSTFSLLTQLFQLETRRHQISAPVLTLPVGR